MAATSATVAVSTPEPKKDTNEVTLADARKKNRAIIPTLVPRNKSDKTSLSDVLIGALLVASDNSGASLSNEILEVFKDYNVDTPKINEVRAAMASPTFFHSGTFVEKLSSLGVQPELQKPRDFNFPPGTQVPVEELRYWPTRFAEKPDLKNYENGDLVYSVQEDKSFTVLSAEQQTVQWQSQNHLVPMNLLETVGGKKEAKATK